MKKASIFLLVILAIAVLLIGMSEVDINQSERVIAKTDYILEHSHK